MAEQGRRENRIKGGEHEDTVEQLIAAGWTSTGIVMYLKARYGVQITDSAVRHHRAKHREEIEAKYPDLVVAGRAAAFDTRQTLSDQVIDTIGEMADLIFLQKSRIQADVQLEKAMGGKNFASTRSEIKLLAELLGQYQELLVDHGLAPGHTDNLRVDFVPPTDTLVVDVPLVDQLPAEDRRAAIGLARQLHELGRGASAN